MAGNIDEMIKKFSKNSLQPTKEETKPSSKVKTLPKIRPKRKEKPYALCYDNTLAEVTKYLAASYKQKPEGVLSSNEYTLIDKMQLREKVEIENLMTRIVRFSELFMDARIASKRVKWHYSLYAVATSFLDELMKEILVIQERKPFLVVDVNDRSKSNATE